MKSFKNIKNLLIFLCAFPIVTIIEYWVASSIGKHIIGCYISDRDWITFYGASMSAFIASLIPLFVLYFQLQSSHNQFSYTQKKDDLINITNISLDYLKIYNIDGLKQLLFDWQYSHKAKGEIQKTLDDWKDNADRIWLKLTISLNRNKEATSKFISLQKSNYLVLGEIYEDLRILFRYDYSIVHNRESDAYAHISESRNRLTYCLTEKLLVKAIFEDYHLSYNEVKNQIFAFIENLRADLNKTYKIYGKTENEER